MRVSEELIYHCPKSHSALNYKWGKISFKETGNRTDLWLYGERSYLLLPSEGEENRFVAKANSTGIDFYIGSTSQSGYQAMRAFFMKLYDCRVDSEEPERSDSSESIALLNKRIRGRNGSRYFPGFLGNILYLPTAIENLELLYEVVIRSAHSIRKGRLYNFCTLIGIDYDGRPTDEIREYIRNDITRMSMENKWRLKLKRRPAVRFRTDFLRDPTNLCNFVRFPYDEGV